MGSLFFVIKSFFITLVILILLQIKIGNFTLENRINNFVHTSGIIQPAQQVADGLVRFIRNSWRSMSGNFKGDVGGFLKGSDAPGERHNQYINLERSAEYIKEKAENAKETVQSHLREEGILEEQEVEEH